MPKHRELFIHNDETNLYELQCRDNIEYHSKVTSIHNNLNDRFGRNHGMLIKDPTSFKIWMSEENFKRWENSANIYNKIDVSSISFTPTSNFKAFTFSNPGMNCHSYIIAFNKYAKKNGLDITVEKDGNSMKISPEDNLKWELHKQSIKDSAPREIAAETMEVEYDDKRPFYDPSAQKYHYGWVSMFGELTTVDHNQIMTLKRKPS